MGEGLIAFNRIGWLILLMLIAGTVATSAQTPAAPGPDDPVARVRENQSWEYGPFVNWGTGVGDRSDFKFFWAGVQLSKPVSPVVHAGILSGQFEFGGNIMPLWQAYTPVPRTQNTKCVTPGGQR